MESDVFNKAQNRKAIPIGRVLFLLLIILFFEIGSSLIYINFIGKNRINPLLFTAIQRIFEMCLVFGFMFKWHYGVSHLGLSRNRIKNGLIHGLFWCLGFGFLVGLFAIVLLSFGVNPHHLLKPGRIKPSDFLTTPSDLMLKISIQCLLGPMVEDLVFIGLIYNAFRARLNLFLSVLTVAALFALAHGCISLSSIIPFVGGLLFTLSFEFSGSLITPIIIHSCGNLAILMIQLL